MATNNGTPKVHIDTHARSFSNSEAGALNIINGNIIIIKNGVINKERAYINDITEG